MSEPERLDCPSGTDPEDALRDDAPDQSGTAKNPVARILEDAGAVDANTLTAWQSNSDTAKNAFYETIHRKKKLARGSSFEATCPDQFALALPAGEGADQ